MFNYPNIQQQKDTANLILEQFFSGLHFYMGGSLDILQKTEMYPPLSTAECNTIDALCEASGMRFYRDQISSVAVTLPVHLSGEFLTLSRIIKAYRDTTNPTIQYFGLTAQYLENFVIEIDHHSQNMLGYYFYEKLKQECQLLIPRPIHLYAPMEDLCKPLQTFFMNRTSIQCRTIGAALFLFILRRIYIGHPELCQTNADWSSMIRAVTFSQNTFSIPSLINERGVSILAKITTSEPTQKMLTNNSQECIEAKYEEIP